ncbi:MAG: hypothetical protein PVH88_15100 [Ignavibacteria bacterium]|jgi:hypothetical protein
MRVNTFIKIIFLYLIITFGYWGNVGASMNEISYKTSVPITTVNIWVTVYDPGRVKVSWETLEGADGYNIYWTEDPNSGFTKMNDELIDSLQTVVYHNVDHKKTYYFKVEAIQAGETLGVSDIVQITMPPFTEIQSMSLNANYGEYSYSISYYVYRTCDVEIYVDDILKYTRSISYARDDIFSCSFFKATKDDQTIKIIATKSNRQYIDEVEIDLLFPPLSQILGITHVQYSPDDLIFNYSVNQNCTINIIDGNTNNTLATFPSTEGEHEYTLENLPNGSYYFYVEAVNENGSSKDGLSYEVNNYPPQNLTAEVNLPEITLNWDDISRASQYFCHWSEDPATGYNWHEDHVGKPAVIRHCDHNKTYYFKIEAQNSQGECLGLSEAIAVETPTLVEINKIELIRAGTGSGIYIDKVEFEFKTKERGDIEIYVDDQLKKTDYVQAHDTSHSEVFYDLETGQHTVTVKHIVNGADFTDAQEYNFDLTPSVRIESIEPYQNVKEDILYTVRPGQNCKLYVFIDGNIVLNGRATYANCQVTKSYYGLAPGIHALRVEAVNSNGTGIAEQEFITGLHAPLNVTATALSQNKIQVNWDSVAAATGYDIYISDSPTGNYPKANTSECTQNSYIAKRISNQNTFYIKLKAYDEQDVSEFSDSVSVTLPSFTSPIITNAAAVSPLQLNIELDNIIDIDSLHFYLAEVSGEDYNKVHSTSEVSTLLSFDPNNYHGNYSVKVEATCNGVSSGLSASVTVTLPAIVEPKTVEILPVNSINPPEDRDRMQIGTYIFQSGTLSIYIEGEKKFEEYYSVNEPTVVESIIDTIVCGSRQIEARLETENALYTDTQSFEIENRPPVVWLVEQRYESGLPLPPATIYLKYCVGQPCSLKLFIGGELVEGSYTEEEGVDYINGKLLDSIYTEAGAHEILADTLLGPGRYSFYLEASNENGTYTCPSINPAVAGAVAPQNVNITATSETTIDVTWDDVNADYYKVFLSNDPDYNFEQINVENILDTQFSYSGLIAGNEYYLKVGSYFPPNDIGYPDTAITQSIEFSMPGKVKINNVTFAYASWLGGVTDGFYINYSIGEPGQVKLYLENELIEDTLFNDSGTFESYFYEIFLGEKQITAELITATTTYKDSILKDIAPLAPDVDILDWEVIPVLNDERNVKVNFTVSQDYEVDFYLDDVYLENMNCEAGYNDYTIINPSPGDRSFEVRPDGPRGGWPDTLNFNLLPMYAINLSVEDTAKGSINPNGNVFKESGENLTFEATPKRGYEFDYFMIDTTTSLTGNPDSLTNIDADHSVVAYFKDAPVLTVNLSALPADEPSLTEALSKSPNEPYYKDDEITVKAGQVEGFVFENWTEEEVVVSTDTIYTFTLTSNTDLVANYSGTLRSVTVVIDPVEGGIIESGEGDHDYGSTVEVLAAANSGYEFDYFLINGDTTKITDNPYIIESITTDYSIEAYFATSRSVVTVVIDPVEGGIIESGEGEHEYGSRVEVLAAANSGYEFDYFLINEDTTQITDNPYIIESITTDYYIEAYFTAPSQWEEVDGNLVYNRENGRVGIGVEVENIPTDVKLVVGGTLTTEEAEVELTGNWSDYVFNKEYKLKSKEELANYIRENGHLPGMPSSKEVQENGFEAGIISKKLLEKIEELTLYVIADNKGNNSSIKYERMFERSLTAEKNDESEILAVEMSVAATTTTGEDTWELSGDDIVYNKADGRVGIGVSPSQIPSNSIVAVGGKTLAEEIIIKVRDGNGSWPDYVFTKSYNLMSKKELKKYISENGKLPGIPRAAEVEEKGFEIGIMSRKLLEKIEELTLYVLADNAPKDFVHQELFERNHTDIDFDNNSATPSETITSGQWNATGNDITYTDGKVIIGTDIIPSDANLAVGGKIIVEEMIVKPQSSWPDYVFKNDYKLMPLNKLEEYIKKNKHLPDIPGEKDIKENGIELEEIYPKLLEKIEELTLYIVEHDNKINELENKFEKLSK